MNMQEFESQIARLVTEYDNGPEKRIYGTQRVAAIFAVFRNYPLKEFRKIIDRAFVTERFPPLAKELLRIAEEIRVEEHNKLKNLSGKRKDFEPAGPTVVKESLAVIYRRIRGSTEEQQ